MDKTRGYQWLETIMGSYQFIEKIPKFGSVE